MYFCVEGGLNVLSQNEKRIVNTIQPGGYFGEVAMFIQSKRNATVKAISFCLLKQISKEDLDDVFVHFP